MTTMRYRIRIKTLKTGTIEYYPEVRCFCFWRGIDVVGKTGSIFHEWNACTEKNALELIELNKIRFHGELGYSHINE